jgi:carbon monoxide dehydrogenase subunit G
MRKSIIHGLAALMLATATLAAPAVPSNEEDIVVRVQKSGGALGVYAELTVPTTPERAWEVLVDYDRMDEILSSVDDSRIVKQEGNQLEVVQTSHLRFGPFKISLHNRRRVELVPQTEIRSHLIEGDLRASDFTTRLMSAGAQTRVTWRGRIVPGPLARLAVTVAGVEAELHQLCQDLRAEILRREARRMSPACRLARVCE